MFATASYILLDVENRKLKICYDGQDGFMMRRGDNILEVGKAGRIPLGILKTAITSRIFFTTTRTIGIPLFEQAEKKH